MTKFKTVALIGRRYTQGVSETLTAIIKYLQKKNVDVIIEKETAIMLRTKGLKKIDGHNLTASKCNLIIVVGGDGSLLNAARTAVDQDIPVVGINRGNLGFLTDINPDDIKSIGKILQGNYIEETRFLLNATIKHENHIINQDLALNDVVLLPSEINRMIEFSVYIDNHFVCNHRADGMIVATPTGSTAHALSGGGPILHPGLDAIVLLPMFPHNLSSRPIVVKGDSLIEIVMAEDCIPKAFQFCSYLPDTQPSGSHANLFQTNLSARCKRSRAAEYTPCYMSLDPSLQQNRKLKGEGYKAYPNISCDGQKLVPIPNGGKINIKKHQNKLRLIHLNDYNYYETLRAKLKWENK